MELKLFLLLVGFIIAFPGAFVLGMQRAERLARRVPPLISTEQKLEILAEVSPDALLADGFEDAYLGYTTKGVAVYSRSKCIVILMERDGMDHDGAEEFFSFNVEGAYMGEFTPLFFEDEN